MPGVRSRNREPDRGASRRSEAAFAQTDRRAIRRTLQGSHAWLGRQSRGLLREVATCCRGAGLISTRTKAALAAAKARGKRLGGNRGASLSEAAQAIGRSVQSNRAHKRAKDLGPLLKELRAAGIHSANGLANALNERDIPTARGRQSGEQFRYRGYWLKSHLELESNIRLLTARSVFLPKLCG
jgi:hypothetical protein